jgi:hypothetical protein
VVRAWCCRRSSDAKGSETYQAALLGDGQFGDGSVKICEGAAVEESVGCGGHLGRTFPLSARAFGASHARDAHVPLTKTKARQAGRLGRVARRRIWDGSSISIRVRVSAAQPSAVPASPPDAMHHGHARI